MMGVQGVARMGSRGRIRANANVNGGNRDGARQNNNNAPKDASSKPSTNPFSSKHKATVNDLRGPAALRSTLVGESDPLESELLERFEPKELLGQGAYGMVHRMQDKSTGQCRVMKTVARPENWDEERLKLEAELMRNLDHPHILRIFSWYEEGDAINIVMEHCSGGELMKVVREGRSRGQKLPESWAATAIRQTFEALVYIHHKGIVHKDLKSQNLLLLRRTESKTGGIFEHKPHIVICDWGISEICCSGIFGMRANKVAGTPTIMAPEVWSGSFSPKCDIWSMGCVMFELFTNKLPFEVVGGIREAFKMNARWQEMHKRGPNWSLMKASEEAVHLNQLLLTYKEQARPSAQECLKHNWFNTHCGEELRLSSEEITSLVNAVKHWRTSDPVQRALCLKMAVGCTYISKFARLFSKFDVDKSGVLERTEVNAALLELGLDKATARTTAAALDFNGDNTTEYVEFVAVCLSSLEDKFDDLLRQEFRSLDLQRKGYLTEREMVPLLKQLKGLAAERGLHLKDMDADSDGIISFKEFTEYFGRTGVTYEVDPVDSNTGGVKFSSDIEVGMKEHVRLVKGGTMERMKKDMEASMERASKSMERERLSKSLERKASERSVKPKESPPKDSAPKEAWPEVRRSSKSETQRLAAKETTTRSAAAAAAAPPPRRPSRKARPKSPQPSESTPEPRKDPLAPPDEVSPVKSLQGREPKRVKSTQASMGKSPSLSAVGQRGSVGGGLLQEAAPPPQEPQPQRQQPPASSPLPRKRRPPSLPSAGALDPAKDADEELPVQPPSPGRCVIRLGDVTSDDLVKRGLISPPTAGGEKCDCISEGSSATRASEAPSQRGGKLDQPAYEVATPSAQDDTPRKDLASPGRPGDPDISFKGSFERYGANPCLSCWLLDLGKNWRLKAPNAPRSRGSAAKPCRVSL